MKKPYPFNVLSKKVHCCDCPKPIKMNILTRRNLLLEENGSIPGLRCNSCHHIYEAGRGHSMGKFGHPRGKLSAL